MGIYTSIDLVREGCPELDAVTMDDLTVSSLILDVEKDVEADLSKVASSTELRALTPVPNALERITTYLARHRAYLIHLGNRGNGEESALQTYWRKRYEASMTSVLDGTMSIISDTGGAVSVTMNKTAADKEIVYTTDEEGLCLP